MPDFNYSGTPGCINCRPGSFVTGDPHLIGFFGEVFDFQGQPNRFFNLLSDFNLQINSYFVKWNDGMHGTSIGMIGMKIGNSFNATYLKINYHGEAKINGKKMRLYQKEYFPLGIEDYMGYVELTDTFDGYDPEMPKKEHAGTFENLNMRVNVGNYAFECFRASEPVNDPQYYPYFLNIKSEILNHDVRPHGVIGQTAEYKERIPTGNQGEGVIEGTYLDYAVSSLFADDFKFNRFGTMGIVL